MSSPAGWVCFYQLFRTWTWQWRRLAPRPLRLLAPNTGVESNVAQPLWLQCFVSEQAVDGNYDAEFQLSLDPGGSLCVGLSFEIWKYSIPPLEESKIGSAWRGIWRSREFEPYYGSEYWDTHKKAWFDLMLKHRTPPDMVQKQPRPLEDFVYISSKGTKWLGILNVGTYSSGQQGGCPHFTNADLASILASIKPSLEGLKAKGLQNYSYVYGFDEVSAQCEPQLRQVFGAVKQAFPGLKTMAAINWNHVPVDLPLDVWVLQYQYFRKSESPSKWTEAKKELWLYHCIEPSGLEYLNTFVERPSVQGRLLFWLAALWEQQYGRPSGWLYYEMNVWKPCNSSKCGGALQKHPIAWLDEGDFKGTAFTDWPEANFIWQGSLDTIFANGDGQFVYPCPDGPCGSVPVGRGPRWPGRLGIVSSLGPSSCAIDSARGAITHHMECWSSAGSIHPCGSCQDVGKQRQICKMRSEVRVECHPDAMMYTTEGLSEPGKRINAAKCPLW